MSRKVDRTTLASALLAVSLVANVVLSWGPAATSIKKFQGDRRAIDGQLVVGSAVPELRARALNGDPVRLRYNIDKSTLLYVFKPGCKYCKLNLPSIRALADGLAGGYRLVGLCLTKEAPVAYLQLNPLPFEVYYDVDPQDADAYLLSPTPSTIVVSRDGKVVRNLMGAYTRGNKLALEQLFHVSLPEPAQGVATMRSIDAGKSFLHQADYALNFPRSW